VRVKKRNTIIRKRFFLKQKNYILFKAEIWKVQINFSKFKNNINQRMDEINNDLQ
jgi:hypothetical protein